MIPLVGGSMGSGGGSSSSSSLHHQAAGSLRHLPFLHSWTLRGFPPTTTNTAIISPPSAPAAHAQAEEDRRWVKAHQLFVAKQQAVMKDVSRVGGGAGRCEQGEKGWGGEYGAGRGRAAGPVVCPAMVQMQPCLQPHTHLT